MDRQIRWSSTRLVGCYFVQPTQISETSGATISISFAAAAVARHLPPGEDITETGHVLYRAAYNVAE